MTEWHFRENSNKRNDKEFLKSYKKYLSKDEKKLFKEDYNKRGEITLNAFRREFNKYKKTNYKIIEEIIKNLVMFLIKGIMMPIL